MSTKNIPGIGPCEVTRDPGIAARFWLTTPTGAVLAVDATATGCDVSVYSGVAGWEVRSAIVTHYRKVNGIPAPVAASVNPAFEAGMSADQDTTNAYQLRRMGFRAAA